MIFQSVGENKTASLLSTLRSGLVFIPILVGFTGAFGLFGVQIAQPATDVITFFITLPFAVRFMKKLNDMERAGE